MRRPVLNRDFQHPTDGWYMIEPAGEHPNSTAGVVQVVDAPAIKAIVDQFNQAAQAGSLSHGSEMLIDHEHFKHDSSKETTAYGWLYQLQGRPEGIYGKIRWTATGQAAVDGGDYRFFSTEYAPADMQTLNPGATPARVRPLRLDGLTLTNDPNNKGGDPITNRAGQPATGSPGTKGNGAVAEQLAPLADAGIQQWFAAVEAIRQQAIQAKQPMPGFVQAWELCRQRNPELYSAVFGAALPDVDEQEAAGQVVTLANRVRLASGMDGDASWNFVRVNLPNVFNRMGGKARANAVTNRATTANPAISARARAAAICNRLVAAEQANGANLDQAWYRVGSARPALMALAAGRCTVADALARDPELTDQIL